MSRDETRTKTQEGILKDLLRTTPVDREELRFRRRVLLVLLAVLLLLGAWFGLRFYTDRPVDYADVEEHFKYGSIGSEPGGSVFRTVGGALPPYWIFQVMPEVCPDQLPGGYASLGFLFEDGRDRPIGVSKRFRVGFDMVGLNCAVCHTGTVRESPDSEPQLVLGMPAHTLHLQGLLQFFESCSGDARFTPENVLGKIMAAGADLNFVDRLLYRFQLIPRTRDDTLTRTRKLARLIGDEVTPWGRGRVDTFNPYKALQFNWLLSGLSKSELTGASDYPSLWNQEPREGMQLHWDGNNPSVDERNRSAALGAGVTPTTLDHARLKRVRDWSWELEPPAYPWQVDEEKAALGESLYQDYCLDCHADHRFRERFVTPEARRVGKVVAIDRIGTDPFRLNSYTYVFAANQYTLYPDSRYRFTKFRKTNGYANHPLDGIWAKAPYLHNGSVPNLRYLLDTPESRPKSFYRGYDVFDQEGVGFVYDVAEANGIQFTFLDTSMPGNSNSGHSGEEYGTNLASEDKDAIVEYLKRF